jgi:pseudaminic acid biosynthesis-associated methylase
MTLASNPGKNPMNVNAHKATDQIRKWVGDFGRQYTDRNQSSAAELDESYRTTYGISRTELNRRFLADVPKNARILEVGCNIGTQLLVLKEMGFSNLSGVEIQTYAIEQAKERLQDAQILSASAFSLPFEDKHFDLVFTSGVLIHIAPSDLPAALTEIHRCCKNWIWGLEYYAPQMTEVVYRGNQDLLWKTDYARLYLDTFADLDVVREERLPYLENENVDAMFLLRRRNPHAA